MNLLVDKKETDVGFTIKDFIRESNKIEGINRPVSEWEVRVLQNLLDKRTMTVMALREYVTATEPGAILRDKVGLNVRVGSHRPPKGGGELSGMLVRLLNRANQHMYDSSKDGCMTGLVDAAFIIHHRYEHLHPFTDCNGRSGRALWLWMSGGIVHTPLGFLHHWYYKSLENRGA